MKKLALYAMIASCIISLVYVIKLQWFVETDYEFWRITVIAALGEIGLWCFYHYARDYEAIREHEERSMHLAQRFAMMAEPDEEPEQKQ